MTLMVMTDVRRISRKAPDALCVDLHKPILLRNRPDLVLQPHLV